MMDLRAVAFVIAFGSRLWFLMRLISGILAYRSTRAC